MESHVTWYFASLQQALQNRRKSQKRACCSSATLLFWSYHNILITFLHHSYTLQQSSPSKASQLIVCDSPEWIGSHNPRWWWFYRLESPTYQLLLRLPEKTRSSSQTGESWSPTWLVGEGANGQVWWSWYRGERTCCCEWLSRCQEERKKRQYECLLYRYLLWISPKESELSPSRFLEDWKR